MAILESLPGLEVYITIEEEPAREYVDQNDDTVSEHDMNVTRYIRARPGANFAVHISFTNKFAEHTNYTMAAHVYVDGVRTNRRTFPLRVLRTFGQAIRIDDAEDTDEDGNKVERQFGFADMLVDDDEELDVPDRVKYQVSYIGEIIVTFYRKQEIQNKKHSKGFGPRQGHIPKLSNLESIGIVPEKALKGRAISHRASFGAIRKTPYSRGWHPPKYRYLDQETHALASFTFRYRSLQDLRAEMIIPCSPSPVTAHEVLNNRLLWDVWNHAAQSNQEVKAECASLELEEGELDQDYDDEVAFLGSRTLQGSEPYQSDMHAPVYLLPINTEAQGIESDDARFGRDVPQDDDEDEVTFVFERELQAPTRSPQNDSTESDLIDFGGWE